MGRIFTVLRVGVRWGTFSGIFYLTIDIVRLVDNEHDSESNHQSQANDDLIVLFLPVNLSHLIRRIYDAFYTLRQNYD